MSLIVTQLSRSRSRSRLVTGHNRKYYYIPAAVNYVYRKINFETAIKVKMTTVQNELKIFIKNIK